MQMHQLRYFLEIAKEQNITTAAKNLYLSQPSLSQQMIKLEAELGVPLLIRHSKSVSLTDAGEQFAQHAQRIIGGVDQLSDLMQKHSLLQAGTLRIGMLWIAGYINLLSILSDYHRLYPNLDYSLKIDGSAALKQLLLERSIHAAFIISSEEQLQQHEDIYYRKIIDDSYVAVISNENPLSRMESIRVSDLKEEKIIMPAQASALRRQLDQLFEQHLILPRILCETSQSDLVIQLAGQNLGIGFASRSIAQALKTDAYSIVRFEHTLYRPIFYITLKELLEYPSIKSFTRYVGRYSLS